MGVKSAGPGLGASILIALALASHAAPAAACGAGETMIFFDPGSAEIRRDQADRLDRFAEGMQRQEGASRILVSGFTDSLGSAASNLDLARRRTESARFYLEARGVPAGWIDLRPVGETDPLLPTPDGVAEPQNRRVTLIELADGTDEQARRRAELVASGGAIPLC